MLAGLRGGGYSSRPLHARPADLAAQTTDLSMHQLPMACTSPRALRTRPGMSVVAGAVVAVVLVLVVVTDSP